MGNYILLSELAERLNLKYLGEDVKIDGLGLCNRNTDHTSILSYITSDKYLDDVRDNEHIACLVLSSDLYDFYSSEKMGRKVSYIVADSPEVCFYDIHEFLCRTGDLYQKFDFKSRIGDECKIASSVVIEDGVIIGNHVTIGPNSVIRSGSIIDDGTMIGCNTTIGSEGFQIILGNGNMPMHITHVGRCHICKNVYIGDNTCVCNSLFDGETYIGEGAKIDNQVHIAHNLYVGKGAVVTAHVIACGSSVIEDGAWIAPNSSILNRVTIGKGAKVGLGSVVTRDVEPYSVVYGCPAKVHSKF